MLRNYITTLFRNLNRNKANTSINVLGLALGITCSIVLFLLATHHKSFDKFHEKSDRIFRVVSQGDDGPGGATDYTPGVPNVFADAFRTDFPMVEKVLFISNKYGNNLITINADSANPKYFEESEGVAFSEKDYFNLFSRKIISGDKVSPLDGPNKVVLSQKMADKYFSDANPVGKVIVLDRETNYQVTAVMENFPNNTDFPFDILLSYATVKEEGAKRGWGSIGSDDQCYLLLADSNQEELINNGLIEFVTKYFGEDNDNKKCFLQPLSSLHYDDRFSNYNYNTISESQIFMMIIVGIFLIVTGCINFINLATAVAIKRSREVGVRKVLGGTRSQLIFQFLGETFFTTFFSVVVSLGLTELALIYFNPFMDLELEMNLLTNGSLQFYLVSILILVSLLAGLYPAFVLSSFKPTIVMKNMMTSKSGKFSLRKGLVVFQFFISQVFIIGTIVLLNQMDLLQNRDLGFISQAVLHIPLPDNNIDRKKTLKTSLQSLSSIEKVSLAFSNPLSGSVSVTNISIADDPEDYRSAMKLADEDYFDVFGMELLAGVGLGNSDTLVNAVVTKEWVKMIGRQDPEAVIGLMVKVWGRQIPIVGVVKDFSSHSLTSNVEPIMLVNNTAYRIAAIKLNASNVKNALMDIEGLWKEVYPEYNYEYTFLDDHVADFYEQEKEMSTIFSIFSAIAIFIGCMGLFGLASFMINQKTKEVGVRKVLGASVTQILSIFSVEFVKLVFMAFLFSAPLAWWGMDQWLQEFEYRVEIGPLVFVIAIIATLVIAFATVGFKTAGAARANPVDSLRNE